MYEYAIAQLEVLADTCDNNAPIWEAEGNAEQAARTRECAESYRAAVRALTQRQLDSLVKH